MSQFVPVSTESGDEFLIEVLPADGQSGITRRSRDVSEKLTNAEFKQMIRQAVMPACRTFVDVWQDLNQPLTADSAEVEFNLGFTASGSAVIVQASAQASFKVKVSWKFKDEGFPISLIRNFFERVGIKEITTPGELYRVLTGEEVEILDGVETAETSQPFKRITAEQGLKFAFDRNILERPIIVDPPPTVQIPANKDRLLLLLKTFSKLD
jgi:Trypsin-co-occurring domain 1